MGVREPISVKDYAVMTTGALGGTIGVNKVVEVVHNAVPISWRTVQGELAIKLVTKGSAASLAGFASNKVTGGLRPLLLGLSLGNVVSAGLDAIKAISDILGPKPQGA